MSVRRPLNVVKASDQKSFFSLFDSKIAVCRETFDVAPDVIVFPCAKIKQVLPPPESLPREAWQRVADGRCLVAFDASTDGNIHTPEGSGRLHDYLAAAGVLPDQAVYITQDRGWGEHYEAHVRRLGLRRMHVAHYDYFLRAFFKDFEIKGQAIYAKREHLFRNRPQTRSRRYICLNLSPRAAKVLLLARLMQHAVFDDGHISFGGFDPHKNTRGVPLRVMLQMIAALPGFGRIAGELMPYVYEMNTLEPVLLGEPRRIPGQPTQLKKQAADTQFDEYSDSYFTVVTETELNSRRISEKALKSLVNFHPSIILGNPGSVEFTRQLGFKSFDGYVDEAYDREPDHAKRFEKVCDETLRLCRLPHAELWRMEQEWAEVLAYNARFGLCSLPAIYRDQIDLAAVDRLTTLFRLDDAPPPTFGSTEVAA